MKKILSCLGALVALCLTFSVSAQTLLYDAAGVGAGFVKVGGSQNYTLSLNGNAVTDGKIVMTAGAKAVNVAVNPAIDGTVGKGATILLYVSDVDVSLKGQFLSIRNASNGGYGGLKIRNSASDGSMQATWQDGEWATGALTLKYPTDKSANVVSYSYLRDDSGAGGKGSAFYLNGAMSNNWTGLKWTGTFANIAIGGLSSANSTFLNTGMKIHRIQIYAGELTIAQLQAAEIAIKTPLEAATYDLTVTSNSKGTASFGGGATSLTDVAIGTSVTATATATAQGYIFEKWVSANDETVTVSTANPYTFQASQDLNLKAIFALPSVVNPANPVAGDGKWYFVKSQRSAGASNVTSAMSVPNWWTIQTGGKVIPQALTKSDEQKFQIVPASTGKVTFNAFNGNTASITDNRITFTGTTPVAAGWTLTSNVVGGVQGYAFPGEASGIHQGAGGWSWELGTGYYSLGDNCTYFFYEASPDFDFRASVEDAKITMSGAKVGNNLGCTSQQNIDIYEAAIVEALQTVGSDDVEAIAAAKAKLDQATAVFKASKIQLISSTKNEPVYYYIANKNPGYSKDRVIYTTDATAQCKWGENTTPTLNMLFRVEKHATANTYRIINAAFPDGELVSQSYGTTNSTYWSINELVGNDGPQFNIINGGTTLHAQQTGSVVVNWAGGYNSASAWTFVPFTGDLGPLYQTQYNDLVAKYATLVDADGNPIGYVLGTATGEYSQEAFEAIKTAYTAMVEDMNAGGATIASSIANLTTAISTFQTSKVMPKPFNGTINPTGKYSLKYINPASPLNGRYLSNPRTSEMDGDEDERPYATLSESFDQTSCLWFITASSTEGKYVITSNRRENDYLDEEGRVRDGSTYDDNIWTTKTLMQDEETWNAATSLLIIKIDQNSNFYNSNSESGLLSRNADNWSYYKLEMVTATSVGDITSSVRAIVINGSIKVGGSTQVDVYTTTGVKVQNKNLKPGVYVAKSNGASYKVIVK